MTNNRYELDHHLIMTAKNDRASGSFMQKRRFNGPLLLTTVASSLLLTACGGGGDGGGGPLAVEPIADLPQKQLVGAAVKGPIIEGTVSMYLLDPDASDLRAGPAEATGTTDSQARMQGVSLPDSILQREDINDLYFLIEVTGGTSLTTGNAPVVDTIKTIIQGRHYQRDLPIFATPLSTLAVELYARLPKGSRGVLVDLNAAADQVIAAFGLGVIDATEISLFFTPPIATESGAFGYELFISPDEDLDRALRYRTASETFAAVVVGMQDELAITEGTPRLPSQIISLIAEDLIDGTVNGGNAIVGLNNEIVIVPVDGLSSLADVVASVSLDPATLNIPGTGVNGVPAVSISDINQLLVDESAQLLAVPLDNSAVPAAVDPAPASGGTSDADNDGVADGNDLFPENSAASRDRDGDCQGLVMDFGARDAGTANGDGNASCADGADLFPDDPGDYQDSDGDGVGDNADDFPGDPTRTTDSDGDGVDDTLDYAPNDPDIQTICDDLTADPGERIAAGCNVDSDNDGVSDATDVFPFNPNESADRDADCPSSEREAPGNMAVDAGEGCGDESDVFPDDTNELADSDSDGVGDNGDVFPNNPNESGDFDGDCPVAQTTAPGNLAIDAGDGCGDNTDISYCYTFANNTITSGQVSGDFTSIGTAVLEVFSGKLSLDQPDALAQTTAGIFVATEAILDTMYEFFLYDPDLLSEDPLSGGAATGGISTSTTTSCTETGGGFLFTTCGTFDLGVVVPVAPIISAAVNRDGGVIETDGTSGGGAVRLQSTIVFTPLAGNDGEISSTESCNFTLIP